MSTLGGPISEVLASVGAVAAGGAFIGTAVSILSPPLTARDHQERLEALAENAAIGSIIAVVLASLEGAVT